MAVADRSLPRFLSPEQAGELYGFSPEYLRRMARQPDGPPSYKVRNLVRFERGEFEDWLAGHRRDPSA
jgi:hypothetical protein